MNAAAFKLADLAFPVTTDTPEFDIDDWQWNASAVVPPPPPPGGQVNSVFGPAGRVSSSLTLSSRIVGALGAGT